jgi:hypothetical protein
MSKYLDRLKTLDSKKWLPQQVSKVAKAAFDTFDTAQHRDFPESSSPFDTFDTSSSGHVLKFEEAGKQPRAEGRQDGNAHKIEPDNAEDRQLATGRECLLKTANSPAPTPLPQELTKPTKLASWPAPKIAKTSPFGANEVPSRYRDGWQALLAGCPPWAAPWQWETAIFDIRNLFGEWGAELLRLSWQPNDIFDRWHGLAWFLRGQHVTAIGPRHAFPLIPVAEPVNGTIEIAGPDAFPIDEIGFSIRRPIPKSRVLLMVVSVLSASTSRRRKSRRGVQRCPSGLAPFAPHDLPIWARAS